MPLHISLNHLYFLLFIQTISVHYEDVQPVCDTPTHSVLFLHSGVFTSAVWLDTLTVYHLAKQGYRAVAIDLPGD